jgi:hypothetical protein
LKNKAKVVKHRNLATHLMNYTANPELNKSALSMKDVQTFLNVSESDDFRTVSNCIIAISNISSNVHVRNLLFEINAMHKFTNLISFVKGRQAMWASSLLYYYFSCDSETEDRIYNSSNSLLLLNSTSKESDIRLLTLYTLNNLLPCIDRQRIVEISMRMINAQFEASMNMNVLMNTDKNLVTTFILVMQNISAFSNTHVSLMNLNLIGIIGQMAIYAAKNKNIGFLLYSLIFFLLLFITLS